MKRFLLSLVWIYIGAGGLLAQDDTQAADLHIQRDLTRHSVIAFGMPGIKFKMKYEKATSNYISFGVHGKFYPWPRIQQGVMAEPFFRYYPAENAPEQGYIQLKIAFGYFRNSNSLYYLRTQEKDRFFAGGTGIAGGYQFLLGPERRLAIDLWGGFHVYYMPGEDPYDVVLFNMVETVFLDLGFRIGVAY